MTDSHLQNNFDFLRFFAAFLVIITHSYAFTGIGNEDAALQLTSGLFEFSFFGVRIFFIMSGYLVVKSLESSSSYASYLWKRSLRIFPGLAVLLVLCVFLLGPLFTTWTLSDYFKDFRLPLMLKNIFLYRLCGQLPGVFENLPVRSEFLGSLWTLSYEFTLYIGLILLKMGGILSRRWLILFFVLVSFLLLSNNMYFGFLCSKRIPLLWLNDMQFFEFSYFFGCGVFFYFFRDKIRFSFPLFMGLFISYILILITHNTYFIRSATFLFLPYFTFYAAFFKCKLNKFGQYGDFSFGMYIYGFPVQQLIVYLTNNRLNVYLMILLSVTFIIPLAYLSWKLVESKALLLKKYTSLIEKFIGYLIHSLLGT